MNENKNAKLLPRLVSLDAYTGMRENVWARIRYVYYSDGREILSKTARTFSNFDDGSESAFNKLLLVMEWIAVREFLLLRTMIWAIIQKIFMQFLDPKKYFLRLFFVILTLIKNFHKLNCARGIKTAVNNLNNLKFKTQKRLHDVDARDNQIMQNSLCARNYKSTWRKCS